MKQKTQVILAFILGSLLFFGLGLGAAKRLTQAQVYELDFGNGRIHFVSTYRGAAYFMLRMEPGAVSVYDLPKGKKSKGNGK